MTQPEKPLRCRACQLQLCKGRDERPHDALQEVVRDEALRGGIAASTHFTCQTCGATMLRSMNLAEPGWSHQR